MDILKDKPATPFRVPREVRLVKVDGKTGLKRSRGKGVVWEAFKKGEGPKTNRNLLGVQLREERKKRLPKGLRRPKTGSGGLY